MQMLIDFYIVIKKHFTQQDFIKNFMETSLIGKALDFGSR